MFSNYPTDARSRSAMTAPPVLRPATADELATALSFALRYQG